MSSPRCVFFSRATDVLERAWPDVCAYVCVRTFIRYQIGSVAECFLVVVVLGLVHTYVPGGYVSPFVVSYKRVILGFGWTHAREYSQEVLHAEHVGFPAGLAFGGGGGVG